jgi:hypothetical protein
MNGLIFTAAALVGLVGRKGSIDKVLVCIFALGIVGGLFTLNDHEAMVESLRRLTP